MPDTTQAVVGWRTSDPPKVNVNVGLLIVSGSFHGEAYYGGDDDGRDECWRWACGAKVYGEVDLWMPMPTREDAGVMAALHTLIDEHANLFASLALAGECTGNDREAREWSNRAAQARTLLRKARGEA